MAGHAWRWVLVSLLVLSACGRSNSTDEPALGGQPATGGVTPNAGSAGNGGDSRGGTGPSAGGTANGGAEAGAPPVHGGAAEAGAATGGVDAFGGTSSGGTSSGGTQSEGGSSAALPVEYETCCYIGGYVRVFITKFDPNTLLCISVSFTQGPPVTEPTTTISTIDMPEGFWFEQAIATYLQPGEACVRKRRTEASHEATSARGKVSWDMRLDCQANGVSAELAFSFAGIDNGGAIHFDSLEPSCN